MKLSCYRITWQFPWEIGSACAERVGEVSGFTQKVNTMWLCYRKALGWSFLFTKMCSESNLLLCRASMSGNDVLLFVSVWTGRHWL